MITNEDYKIKRPTRTLSLGNLNLVNYSSYANEKRDPRKSAKTEYRRSTSEGDFDTLSNHKLRDNESKDTKRNSYKLITEKNEKDFVTFCPKQRVSDEDFGIEILSCNESVTCHLPKSTEQTKIEILPETFKIREKTRPIKLNRILATAAENDPEYDTTSKVTLASDLFPNEFYMNMLEDAFSGMSELNLLDRQREFYQSIKNKTPHECKSILESKMLHDFLPLLTTALANAVAAGNHEIGTIIHYYIIDNSPKILQLFHRTNGKILQDAKVWMGTECFCNKTEEGQYEDSICNKPRPLLVVEGNDALKSLEVQEFNGFQIKVITDSSIRRNESKVAAERQLPESQQKLEKIPKSVAKLRFKRHSNLTMIRPSAFKSIGFETPDHKVLETSCISLFCHIKGIIPIGEHHFPLKIKGVPTDVLEGTSYLQVQFISAIRSITAKVKLAP
ncbi:unnamed protein product [Mytilus edulis]|uniref:Uncharacterized protein n=1 Tax=Mytilus edulis TaxID=6550 RepID=A0A8S3TDR4_MYTED|nr:unnamed protein product [Mytilus edulis]